jgi:hypothetical protein
MWLQLVVVMFVKLIGMRTGCTVAGKIANREMLDFRSLMDGSVVIV